MIKLAEHHEINIKKRLKSAAINQINFDYASALIKIYMTDISILYETCKIFGIEDYELINILEQPKLINPTILDELLTYANKLLENNKVKKKI